MRNRELCSLKLVQMLTNKIYDLPFEGQNILLISTGVLRVILFSKVDVSTKRCVLIEGHKLIYRVNIYLHMMRDCDCL